MGKQIASGRNDRNAFSRAPSLNNNKKANSLQLRRVLVFQQRKLGAIQSKLWEHLATQYRQQVTLYCSRELPFIFTISRFDLRH